MLQGEHQLRRKLATQILPHPMRGLVGVEVVAVSSLLDIVFNYCKLTVQLVEVGAGSCQGGIRVKFRQRREGFSVGRVALLAKLFDVLLLLFSERGLLLF